ncbi:magnesium and cobalt transport protein CorA [Antrihabitans sp. YC2-6]|uniref:magnesium and cobalt transport protein CorA n=1 Tax=Antrihabitans sp. YC2-6 TaxID=2799498 RepID=UPI0018F624E3|nr:magnesium and cobalt transport protein CorA [Antrihabitans sp. YC2-6]MBJ8346640.1 magnesium and cobalt transport protein CorA [Antrihabitans sp. YC2-6]
MDDCVVDCAVYVGGERTVGHLSHQAALEEVRRRGTGFCWVGLYEPNDRQMESIATTFGLHELAVEDVVHAHQRPKLERYDDLVFLVLRTVQYLEHGRLTGVSRIVDTGEIMVLVGSDFVITVRHGEHTGLAGVRHMLEDMTERLALGPMAVLHAVADHVVDTYVDVAQRVEQDIDAMEQTVFTPNRKIEIEPIYQLKHEILEFRRSVNPLAAPLQILVSPAGDVPKEIRRYLRDVADHHTHVADEIAVFDDAMSAMIGASLAKVATQQNSDLRKISAIVALAAVPTMFAGVYGMNFEHMPELSWTVGYPLLLTLVATVCVGLFVVFRVKRWL